MIHMAEVPKLCPDNRFPLGQPTCFPRTCRDNQAGKKRPTGLHISVDFTDFPQVERRKVLSEVGDPKEWCRDASPHDFPHYRFAVSDYRTMNKHDDIMWKIRIVTLS
jgi:hypothetical protein